MTLLSRYTVNKSLDLLLIPVICAVVLIKVYEAYDLSILIVAVTLMYLLKGLLLSEPAKPRFDLFDLSVVLVALAEFISYATSTYPANSIHWVAEALLMLVFYCLIRTSVVHDYQRVAIYVMLTGLAFWISSRALYSFWRHHDRLSGLGFDDPSDFKHLFGLVGPAGYATGERITMFLLLLPFPLVLFLTFKKLGLIKWILLLPVLTLLLALAVTFSRGVHGAILFFLVVASFLMYRYRVDSGRRIIVFNMALGIVLAAALAPVSKPVLTTIVMFKSASQVRSFEGRTHLWRASLEMAARHPWTGAGAFNFPLAYAAYSEAHTGFAAGAFNYLLQILFEKGVIGLAAYLLLLFVFFKQSMAACNLTDNRLHKTALILFMAAIGAAIVRDLTYSSMFVNKGANTLLWLTFAINARPNR